MTGTATGGSGAADGVPMPGAPGPRGAGAWGAAPFARYVLNTFLLISMIPAGQLVVSTLAAFPITVGLLVFASPDRGVSWSLVAASSLMRSAPPLLGFLLFQRAFVQGFMRAGIK